MLHGVRGLLPVCHGRAGAAGPGRDRVIRLRIPRCGTRGRVGRGLRRNHACRQLDDFSARRLEIRRAPAVHVFGYPQAGQAANAASREQRGQVAPPPLVLRRFPYANRNPPRIVSGAGFRPKTLYFFSSRSLRYFSTSRVTSCRSTSGACSLASGATVDRSENRFLTASLSTAVRAAAFSFATISGDVPFGANRPFQPCASNSERPACAEVGRSGSVASRTVEPTTNPLTSLSSIACATEAAASQTPSICPPIASVSAGAAPR